MIGAFQNCGNVTQAIFPHIYKGGFKNLRKKTMVMHPNIVLSENNYGYGLFASAPIEEGEIVWYETEENHTEVLYIDKVDICKFEPKIQERLMRFHFESSLSQVNISKWLEEYIFGQTDSIPWENDPDLSDFMNHSCDPNIWYRDDNTQLARRRIEVGEEVCEDYATDRAGNFDLKCLCGSPLCRGIIRKNDFELPELQQRYGQHFRSLILKAFNEPLFAQKLKESWVNCSSNETKKKSHGFQREDEFNLA